MSSHIDPLSGPSVFGGSITLQHVPSLTAVETPPWPPQNMQAPLPTTDDTAWLTELFLSATAPDPAELMTTTIPLGNPLAFDWGFDVLDNDIFGPIATHAPGSPAQPVDNADADPDLVMAVRATEIDGRLHPTDLPDGQPPEGPWVSPISALRRESPADMSSPTCTSRTHLTGTSCFRPPRIPPPQQTPDKNS